MPGVRLGRRAHHDSSSGVTLADQWHQAFLRHTNVLDQLSWSLDGGETKKVPGTRYQVPHFGDRNARKGGLSQSELSWYCRWKGPYGTHCGGQTNNLRFEIHQHEVPELQLMLLMYLTIHIRNKIVIDVLLFSCWSVYDN